MKKFLVVLVLIFVASASFAQSAGTPFKIQKPDGTFVYAKADVDGNLVISGITTGSGTSGVGTFTMVMPDPVVTQDKIGRISNVTFYTVTLATDTVTNLSDICSFTVPVMIQFDHQGDSWVGAAGASAATVQSSLKLQPGNKWFANPASSTFNVGLISNTTTTTQLCIAVWELSQ